MTKNSSTNLGAMKLKYVNAREVYDNTGEEKMTDAEFDKLEDDIRKLEPSWKELRKTGSGVIGKKKPVALPHYMPSLDKCKVGSGDLPKFLAKAKKYSKDMLAMAKLDGASIFASIVKGQVKLLATRGNGETGKDITFLVPNLIRFPSDLPATFTADIRMEAIIRKDTFAKKYADEGFSSARALVSGVLNRQGTGLADAAMKDIHFVCLRMLTCKGKPISLSEGLTALSDAGFETVLVRPVPRLQEDEESLTAMLDRLVTGKATHPYEVDGLVIHANTSTLVAENEKPDFAFAFKKDLDVDSAPKTTVIDIVWKVSSFGVLVPKAIVDPVDFDGVTVKQCALHNLSWARTMGVGIGSVVGVLRSGEIIPKIVKVYKQAVLEMPDPKKYGNYEWDATDTNLVLIKGKEDNRDVAIQTLVRFFGHCELDAFGPALAEQLVDSGKGKTEQVVSIVDQEEWFDVCKSNVMAKRYAATIAQYRANPNLSATMAASGCFPKGVGRTRIETLIKVHPKLHSFMSDADAAGKAQLDVCRHALDTPGCGEVFSTSLAQGWPAWVKWLKVANLTFIKAVRKAPVTGKLKGSLVSFTGYRDKEQEKWVSENGGTVVTFGAKTSVLLYKDGGKASGKVASAQERGIRVTTFEQLKKGI